MRNMFVTPTILGLLAITAIGCSQTVFRDARPAVGPLHERWTSHFVFGLVGHEIVDVREFCPSGDVKEVSMGTNFGTWLVSLVTLGIYSPNKVYIRCAFDSPTVSASAYEISIDPATNRPTRVVRREGERVYAGVPVRAGDSKTWGVDLQEEVR